MQAHLVQELLEMTAFVFEPSLEGGRTAPQQIGDARQRRRVGQVLLQMAIETKAQAVATAALQLLLTLPQCGQANGRRSLRPGSL